MRSTIYHLELTSRSQLNPSHLVDDLELRGSHDAALNARFYREVGGDWQWTDRLTWTEVQWREWLERGSLHTWVAFFRGEEAGYVELEVQRDGNVEIVYFGLLPAMVGMGLGGGMLTLATSRAWEIAGTKRVWLHTCTEDHPHALANYEKRGFRLFRTEVV